jgi:platelet-activating factor acetylhydrolase
MFSYLNPIPALPQNPGPLAVGSTEYEIPVSEIPSPSPVPDPAISTIKFRVFYPASSTATSRATIHWLPNPQHQWLEAYASFLGASPRLAKLFSYTPNPLKHISIPAVSDAPVLTAAPSRTKYPVVIFSHGLGGSFNAYSSILGALTSCGIICVAPEHRDQSCPISLIRKSDGTTTSVPYLTLSHNPTADVLTARNDQLRIRLWELELVYTALNKLDSGEILTNLAKKSTPSLQNTLDLSPGNVTWAGHSFGGASVVQLVKSVFWSQSIPTLQGTEYEDDPAWRPLYTPADNSALSRQITSRSPLVLLDLWTMPLREQSTKWLWEKPLPCWTEEKGSSPSNVVAIMSEGFYKWSELLRRTKSLLSQEPSKDSPSPDTDDVRSPRLFYAPKTAHLSQSDFGCLFPWVGRRFLNAEQPERTILLNVRAFLQLFRERGVHVESFNEHGAECEISDLGDDKAILASDGGVEGWTPLSL